MYELLTTSHNIKLMFVFARIEYNFYDGDDDDDQFFILQMLLNYKFAQSLALRTVETSTERGKLKARLWL